MKKEHWRIGIMGAIIVVLAFYWFLTLRQKTPASPKTPIPGTSQFSPDLNFPLLTAGRKEEKPAESEIEDVRQGWEKNPFALPSGIRLVRDKEKEPEPGATAIKTSETNLPELKVNSIFISNGRKLAIINNRVVTVGNELGNEKIIDIQRDRVIMGNANQKRTILLDQSPVSLTVKGE